MQTGVYYCPHYAWSVFDVGVFSDGGLQAGGPIKIVGTSIEFIGIPSHPL